MTSQGEWAGDALSWERKATVWPVATELWFCTYCLREYLHRFQDRFSDIQPSGGGIIGDSSGDAGMDGSMACPGQ